MDEMSQSIISHSRRSVVKGVKRQYDTIVSCKACFKVQCLSNLTVGYICRYCGKFNNVDEAVERFNKGEYVKEESKSGGDSPTVRIGTNDYSKMRDEYEIRADLFKNGVTRDNIGANKFNNVLKKELVKNNCYRGADKAGV